MISIFPLYKQTASFRSSPWLQFWPVRLKGLHPIQLEFSAKAKEPMFGEGPRCAPGLEGDVSAGDPVKFSRQPKNQHRAPFGTRGHGGSETAGRGSGSQASESEMNSRLVGSTPHLFASSGPLPSTTTLHDRRFRKTCIFPR